MSAEHFLDTNILIYLFDETAPEKRQTATLLVERSLAGGSGCISWQVVQEALNVMTRKLCATPEDAQRFLDEVMQPLWRIYPSASLYRGALDLQSRYRFSLYDSLIVASALEARCTTLFSEDLQHGQSIASLTILDPFRGNEP